MSPSQPPPPYGPPNGQLVLNLRKPFGLLSGSMISPKVTIDGFPAPVRWDRNAFPVVPGEHHLHLSSSYLWEYGAADQPVTVHPGQSVEVHYSPPVNTFMRGRVGFSEQPYPGMAAFWAIIAVPVVIVLVAVLLVALGS